MDPALEPTDAPSPEPPPDAPAPPATVDGPDLATLERIEGELHAVERALEQIDQGVYDGFAGLDPAPPATG
jgi:hypothetical protein